jgi:protein involved in polysaccharide export with SLBB domain
MQTIKLIINSEKRMDTVHDQGWLRVCLRWLVIVQVVLIFAVGYANSEPQRFARRFIKGDALRLTIWQPWSVGDDRTRATFDFNDDYTIDNRGYAFFPLIGEVKIIGHNTTTLADELKEKFGIYLQEPIVVVEPLIRVALLGSFNRPGTYLIQPDASLWELVDLAGGPAADANLKKIRVDRSGQKVKKELLQSLQGAYSLQEIGIISGDQVHLPAQRSISIRDVTSILSLLVSTLNLYLLIERL